MENTKTVKDIIKEAVIDRQDLFLKAHPTTKPLYKKVYIEDEPLSNIPLIIKNNNIPADKATIEYDQEEGQWGGDVYISWEEGQDVNEEDIQKWREDKCYMYFHNKILLLMKKNGYTFIPYSRKVMTDFYKKHNIKSVEDKKEFYKLYQAKRWDIIEDYYSLRIHKLTS